MKIKKIILCILMITAVSFGVSLTLKAAVGVGAWDALVQLGSETMGLPVGTVGIILNFTCILIQLIILKKEFKIKHALQIIVTIFLGNMINFFYYDVLGNIEISQYYIQLAVLLFGYVLNAFAIATIMLLDVVTFSLEGACNAVANKWGKNFPTLRLGVDALCIVITVGAFLIFKAPLAVREGTIIGMLLFGPTMGMFMKHLKPIYQKLGLIEQ